MLTCKKVTLLFLLSVQARKSKSISLCSRHMFVLFPISLLGDQSPCLSQHFSSHHIFLPKRYNNISELVYFLRHNLIAFVSKTCLDKRITKKAGGGQTTTPNMMMITNVSHPLSQTHQIESGRGRALKKKMCISPTQDLRFLQWKKAIKNLFTKIWEPDENFFPQRFQVGKKAAKRRFFLKEEICKRLYGRGSFKKRLSGQNKSSSPTKRNQSNMACWLWHQIEPSSLD